jgi:deoxyxylulose-5-phosphate synthase
MIHDEDAPYKAVAVAIAENKEITTTRWYNTEGRSPVVKENLSTQPTRRYDKVLNKCPCMEKASILACFYLQYSDV